MFLSAHFEAQEINSLSGGEEDKGKERKGPCRSGLSCTPDFPALTGSHICLHLPRPCVPICASEKKDNHCPKLCSFSFLNNSFVWYKFQYPWEGRIGLGWLVRTKWVETKLWMGRTTDILCAKMIMVHVHRALASGGHCALHAASSLSSQRAIIPTL